MLGQPLEVEVLGKLVRGGLLRKLAGLSTR
jgi:hypothetical protein